MPSRAEKHLSFFEPFAAPLFSRLICTAVPALAFILCFSATSLCKAKKSSSPSASATQTEYVHWSRIYGGDKADWARAAAPASDGGFILAGYTESFGVWDSGDFWAVRLDASGTVLWAKPYGGPDNEEAWGVATSADGGFVLAGEVKTNGDNDDVWIVKAGASGEKLWDKTYGGPGADRAFSIRPAAGGGFIAAGQTEGGAGGADAWVLKLDDRGNIEWDKTFGGADNDWLEDIQPLADGGYIAAGVTFSSGLGDGDFWVLRLDSSGNEVWSKTFGGPAADFAHSIAPAPGGGFAVAGSTESFGAGGADFWVIKLDTDGGQEWARISGGPKADHAYSIIATADGGFVVAGDTLSYGSGSGDARVIKLGRTGRQIWERTFGGSGFDNVREIVQAADGGILAAGQTSSFGAGGDHLWAVRLDPNGRCKGCF